MYNESLQIKLNSYCKLYYFLMHEAPTQEFLTSRMNLFQRVCEFQIE